MSSSGSGRPFLRIVRSHDDLDHGPKSIGPMPTRQPMLFSEASSYTLGFIKATELDAHRLLSLIEQAKPRLIFDLRPAPNFAGGAVSRRTIFGVFERHGTEYYDVAGVLGVSARRDALLNPALLVDAIQVNILRSGKGLSGPVFFFVDDDQFNEEYFSTLAERLPHQDGRGWDIACWPNNPTSKPDSERRLVFISHANPEDNEVAKWLSARLAAEGYQVWSDVTRLIGGELIWDTIEHAIRTQASKVIVLLSRKGQEKPGLLDEINVAIATERAEGLERFVVPIRIDDLPFTLVRANLARKNIIDGSHNLADAFRRTLKILAEDEVPRKEVTQLSVDLSAVPQAQEDQKQWDVLLENKIVITKWPNTIRKFCFVGPTDVLPFINQSIQNGAVTFEPWDVIASAFGGQVQRAGEALLSPSEWPGSNELVFGDRMEMRRALSSILRQGWDRHCQRLGMLSFPLANKSICWFIKNGAVNGNRVRYRDVSGVERSKALVGQSPRRGVFWHFAIEARPSSPDNSIRLVPHVLFSYDGITPIADSAKQHALRRGFCRSWWNARWRDLLTAMLQFLSEGARSIILPVATGDAIEVSGVLVSYDRAIESAVRRFVPGSSSAQLLEFDEPEVAIGYGQRSDYPKEGLLQFGPVNFSRNPAVIRTGVVGTGEGIQLFQKWSRQFNSFRADPAEGRNSIPFTGFEAIFGAKWPDEPVRTIMLSRNDVINSILLQDRHQAVFKTSGLFVDAITRAILNDDINVDVWYVIIPDEVFLYGRPASRVPRAIAIATPNAMGRHTAKRFSELSPSLFPEDNEEALIYDHHLDFHHQLKARLLGVKAVTQVLRESSLATVTSASVENPLFEPELPLPNDEARDEELDELELEELALSTDQTLASGLVTDEEVYEASADLDTDAPAHPIMRRRQMQDAATFSWNIGTTTFFKAGGRPWRVAAARPGVCYIGLIFKKDAGQQGRHACCGAQMFLDDSDGIVFKGAMGPWYSPDTGQFHLDRSEAHRLISMVISAYQDQNGVPPREVFIHGRTRFDENEWFGFCDAVDLSRTRLSAIRITRSNEFKLYSSGELAVKRGTALALGSRLGLLWTSGYISRLGTYPGRETPNPLRIEIVKDSGAGTDIEGVMRDVMMLTKMNFNSCIYSDGVPVTMRFADAIGDVLVTAKDKDVPPLPFRYYI